MELIFFYQSLQEPFIKFGLKNKWEEELYSQRSSLLEISVYYIGSYICSFSSGSHVIIDM